MRKKILSLLCILSILIGMVGILPTKAEAANESFQVGYSRVDINPYVVDGKFSSGIMELPLRGTGDVWNRLSSKMVDDNGDGKVTAEDGLKATCIAVSDHTGNTVLLITVDLIGGTMGDEVRDEIYTRVQEALASGELKNVNLTRDQIHYAGTHTHNAPDTTVYAKNGKTGFNDEGKDLSVINKNLGIWIERTIEDVGDAAILALKDRAAATITKDAISAAADTKSPVKGKVMNSTRHYVNEAGGCVAGDNFNDRGSNPQQITPVNDTMYLLKFSFQDSSKLPIVLANWRGHPSLNNTDIKGIDSCARTCLSSDYVNSFRHALEYDCSVNNNCTGTYKTTQSCRVAFFQGAGGNVNPRGREVNSGVLAGGWIDSYSSTFKDSKGNGYGRVLAAMAQHALSSSARREEVAYGELRSVQQYQNGLRRDTGVTAVSYEAAKAFQALYEVDKNTKLPFIYTSEEGEKFVIGSRFHASNIVSYWDTTYQKAKTDVVGMELNAFMFGEDLAFVTISGEAFDYYYKQLGVYTAANNMWNDLNGTKYGTPFVLGYCNDADGYVPNHEAYDYNLGSEKWMRGSYESNISPYAQGTGEQMIRTLSKMLGMLEGGSTADYQAYCQHCQTNVTWSPYNGTSNLYTGHYYLLEDNMASQIHIMQDQQVCFDLKGHTLKGDTRAFYTYSNGNATLSIMDTSAGETGSVQGRGGQCGVAIGFGGSTILVDKGNTLNLYSGTIQDYMSGNYSVMTAGVIRVGGTFNMYGGTVKGGTVYDFAGEYVKSGTPTKVTKTGQGGTIYNTGTVNVYGGTIEAGKVDKITGSTYLNKNGTYSYSQTIEPTGKTVDGIYMSTAGKLTIGGDAKVADLYLPGFSNKYLTVDTTNGKFTGSLGLTLSGMLSTSGKVTATIGQCAEEADLSGANFTFNCGDLHVYTDGTNLKATAGALLRNLSGDSYRYYATAQDAVKAYTWSETDPSYIQLMDEIFTPLQVDKNLYLDLNGKSVYGDVTVDQGSTLYCMDYQTKDCNVSDGVYGKLSGTITGNVEGVPAMTVGDKPSSNHSYRMPSLMITEADGISFHTLRLYLRHVSLQTTTGGMYYSAYINGDEVIQKYVDSFGIALNAQEPVVTDGKASAYNLYTTNTADQWKSESYYYSVLVDGVMKTENSDEVNAANAETDVYACPYVVIDGQTIWGFEESWSLRQLVEAADEGKKFTGDKLTAALALLDTYRSVMENWNIPRLKMADMTSEQ